jgi:hypothetical protein
MLDTKTSFLISVWQLSKAADHDPDQGAIVAQGSGSIGRKSALLDPETGWISLLRSGWLDGKIDRLSL